MLDPIRSAPGAAFKSAPSPRTSVSASPTISDGFVASEASPAAVVQGLGSLRSELPRPMTEEEKRDFKTWFPLLDVEVSRVTAEATPQYNCISWTTGNTQSWDWPPYMYPEFSPREAFAHYYQERGFRPIGADEAAQIGKDRELVAYWEDPSGPTHGSVAGPEHGERWESKCGQAARITHGRDELESEVYGKIAGYWLRTQEVEAPVPELPQDVRQRIAQKLEARLQALPAPLVADFGQAYAQWQSERSSPRVAMSSDPKAYLQGAGYQKLLALGPQALPLWVEKMHGGDFFCQYAVQQLTRPEEGAFQMKGPQPQPELKAREVRCGEQDKARQMLVQWLESQW